MSVIISPNLIINTSNNPSLPPFPLNHARIGIESILTNSNVTASSESSGFPASALSNPLTYDQWRPSSVPASVSVDNGSTVDVDYIGIAAHNLSSVGAVIDVEYSTDGVSWILLQELSPGDNGPIMLLFETITARYFRFTVEASDVFYIGAVYIGQALVMQRSIYGGHAPITLSRSTEFSPNRSEGGQWLGRSIVRKGTETSYDWSNLTALWYRQHFDPFVKLARTRPFFIAWYPSKFPQEVGFVWVNSDIKPQNMGVRDFMSVSMNVVGLTDD
jgi:hypothetical protein